MQIYQVGPDSLSDSEIRLEITSYDHFVYWYEIGNYDGTGLGAGISGDDNIYYGSLSHCSCFGPTDGFEKNSVPVNLEEFLDLASQDDCLVHRKRSKDDYDYVMWQEVVKKVKEIVEGETACQK